MGAAHYMLTHSMLPQNRVELHVYPSGHQSYIGSAARHQLATDLKRFISADGAERSQPPGGESSGK